MCASIGFFLRHTVASVCALIGFFLRHTVASNVCIDWIFPASHCSFNVCIDWIFFASHCSFNVCTDFRQFWSEGFGRQLGLGQWVNRVRQWTGFMSAGAALPASVLWYHCKHVLHACLSRLHWSSPVQLSNLTVLHLHLYLSAFFAINVMQSFKFCECQWYV